jgi:hypothetical protein
VCCKDPNHAIYLSSLRRSHVRVRSAETYFEPVTACTDAELRQVLSAGAGLLRKRGHPGTVTKRGGSALRHLASAEDESAEDIWTACHAMP